MKFSDFYPYKKDTLPVEDAREDELVAQKARIDTLFTKLSAAEEDLENLKAQQVELQKECDAIITDLKKSPNDHIAKFLLASLFAVKMEIWNKTDDEESIKKNYNDLILMVSPLLKMIVMDLKDDQSPSNKYLSLRTFPHAIRNLAAALIPKLPKALSLKHETAIQQLTIPDLLASKSAVAGNFQHQRFRRIFHDMWWQTESLRPLLEIMAYSACGIEIRESKCGTLEIIFIGTTGLSPKKDSDGKTTFSDGTTGLSTENKIFISLGRDGNSFFFDEIIAGTFIHEAHHQWEKRRHSNNSIPHAKDDVETPRYLEEMLEEVRQLKGKGGKGEVRVVDSQAFEKNFLVTHEFLPHDTFTAVLGYAERDQSAEISG